MSQQEFVPEPQDQQYRQDQQGQDAQSQDNEEVYAEPYYWSTQRKSSNIPKEEHPSTYEESIPPYSYRAQDSATYKKQADNIVDADPGPQQRQERQSQKQQFSSGGNTSGTRERSYRQYNMRWQVPPWARPQPRKPGNLLWRVLMIVVLGVILIKILPFLVGLALAIIGIAAFIILLPLLIIIGLVLAIAVAAGIAYLMFRNRVSRRWRGF